MSRKPRRLKKVINTTLDDIRSEHNVSEEGHIVDAIEIQKHEHNILEYQFLVPPSRLQTLYQICDIKDAKVQKFCVDCHKNKCDKDTGWLNRITIQKIQDILKNKVPKLSDDDHSQSHPFPSIDDPSILSFDQFRDLVSNTIENTRKEKTNNNKKEEDDEEEVVEQEEGGIVPIESEINENYYEEEEEDIFEEHHEEEDLDTRAQIPVGSMEDDQNEEWDNMDMNDEPFDLLDE